MTEEARDDEPITLGFQRMLVRKGLVKLKPTEKKSLTRNLVPWFSWTEIMNDGKGQKKLNKECLSLIGQNNYKRSIGY